MTFSQSGSTITQSGTDVGLGGLIGLTGVTAWTSSAQGDNARAVNIGSNQLVINGTLTLLPEYEYLAQNSAAARPNIDVSGASARLNVGQATVVNGVTRYSSGLALHIGDNGSPWRETDAALRIQSGGQLHWYGGIISAFAAVAFMEGTTIRTYSRNAVFIARGRDGDQSMQIRQRSDDAEFRGLSLIDGNFTVIVPPTAFQGIVPVHCAKVFSPSSSTANNTWISIDDYDASGGNIVDFACWQNKWMRSINCIQGSNVVFGGHLSSDANNRGFCAHYADVALRAFDTENAPISSFSIYTKDRLHGARSARLPNDTFGTNEDFRPDREYAASGDATNPAETRALIAVSDKRDGNVQLDNIVWDYRGEQNSSTDIFNVRIRAYDYLFQTLNLALKGPPDPASTTLFADPAITQDSATAAAHTGISMVRHGSPVSWQSLNWGITVTCDFSVNAALTADDVFHYLKYHLSQTASFNGEFGMAWHNLLKAAGSGFETERGTYGGERTQHGVRVVDENGDPFPGVTRMQSDDGTYYVPPAQATFTLTGLVDGTEVRIYRTSDDVELFGVENTSGGEVAYTYTAAGEVPVYVHIHNINYVFIRLELSLGAQDASVPVQQRFDRNYSNPS